jgi:ABC-type sugar transport system substrate-binding protein
VSHGSSASFKSLELSGAAHSDATSAGADDAKTAGGSTKLPKKALKIGLVEATTQAGAVVREQTGIEQAADILGWKVIPCDGQGVPATMDVCGNKLVQQGVDVIVSLAVASPQVPTALRAAQAAKIPWVNSGILVPDPQDQFTGSIAPGVDEEKSLYKTLDAWLVDKLGSGGGKVGAFEFSPGVNTKAHADQLHEDVAANPQIKIAAEQEINLANPIAGTQSAAAAMLTQHPDLKAIWSFGDLGLLAIAAGVDSLHLAPGKRPLIVGGFPDLAILDGIRKGKVDAAAEFTYEASGWLVVDQIAENVTRGTAYITGLPKYSVNIFAPQVVDKTNVVQDPKKFQTPVVDYVTYFLTKWHDEFGTVAP